MRESFLIASGFTNVEEKYPKRIKSFFAANGHCHRNMKNQIQMSVLWEIRILCILFFYSIFLYFHFADILLMRLRQNVCECMDREIERERLIHLIFSELNKHFHFILPRAANSKYCPSTIILFIKTYLWLLLEIK
jgi:hypothetical protein